MKTLIPVLSNDTVESAIQIVLEKMCPHIGVKAGDLATNSSNPLRIYTVWVPLTESREHVQLLNSGSVMNVAVRSEGKTFTVKLNFEHRFADTAQKIGRAIQRHLNMQARGEWKPTGCSFKVELQEIF